MDVIGITGSLSTGKSSVAAMFQKLGAVVIDADSLAHEFLAGNAAVIREIREKFSGDVFKNGCIDRKALGAVVFKDKNKLDCLNAIIHPRVIRKIRQQINTLRKGGKVRCVVLDVPLLFESGMDQMVDYAIVVKATQRIQILRAVSKLKLSKAQALKRIRMQMPLSKKIRQADIIINNNEHISQTRKQVVQIWEKLQQKIKK